MGEKLAIFLELDNDGNETGRFQAALDVEEGEDSYVWETFDTEGEAQEYIDKMNAEFERNEKIKAEYLAWEKECMARHNISQEDLRVFLANGPVGE